MGPESADMSDQPTQQPLRVIPPQDLVGSDPTPGMRREQAFEAGSLWAGLVHTEPGAVSGWHHHGDHDSSLYLLAGRMRLEFGPGGADAVEAAPGDFVHVPAHVVHRESNPADTVATAVVGRSGTGAPTVNVAGPDPV
jgi:uncharacterized RmlC-like cupin family protein